MNGWYFDIEADSLFLQSTKIWYIKFKSLDGSKQLSVLPFQEDCKDKIVEWINSFPNNSLVVGHNILSYDSWMLWKFFDIKPRVGKGGKDTLNGKKVQFVDTLVLSQYLQPDFQSHSLDFLSSGSESTKMDYRKALVEADAMVGNEPKGFEFSFYHPLIEEYCDADVEAGIGVFNRLWSKAVEMYGEKNWIHPSFRQVQKDFFLYAAQAYSGVKFDKEKAVVLVQHITEKMDELKAQVDPVLPPRELKEGEKKEYKIPAKPFTKSGEMSATMVKWLDKHNAKVIDNKIHAYGFVVDIVANEILPVRPPMEIEDNAELKQYFLDHGWVPSDDHWNFKKGDDGKPIRDDRNNYIKTTPKIMNAGVICPNLLKIEADVPAKVVKFLSYRNRRSVVEGWLANWRIEWDGRLSAEMSGYTPTFRVKHKTVCNVPKADPKVLLGNEMRELFTVDEGFQYVGTDSAALENRTLAAYTMKYDGGAFADLILKGDSHCYSEDTEILTPNGWKTFGDLSPADKVAQWEKGVISFVTPSHIVWEDYEGDMISVTGAGMDFLVTPNHRIPYYMYNPKKDTALDIKVMQAKDINTTSSTVRLPCFGKSINKGLVLSDSMLRLIVATQADGYLCGDSFDGPIRFTFVKQRKIDRMRELLNNCGIKFTESVQRRKGRDEVRFYLNKSEHCKVIRSFLDRKSLSWRLLDMSPEQNKVFLDEIPLWDGTVSRNKCVFDTCCRKSRDVVATVATLSGFKAHCKEYNKVSSFGKHTTYRCIYNFMDSTKTGRGVLGKRKEVLHYKGKIGCVSVPSTFVLVRRNDQIIVSGNTFNSFAFFPHLHERFDINQEGLKDLPEFKPWRNKAKTGAYLLAYGGGVAKLASSLSLSKTDAQMSYDNYWSANPGLGKLKENVEKYYDTAGKKKYVPGWDGRILSIRRKNVLINCLGQSLGAVCQSVAACMMDNKLGEMYLDDKFRPYYLYKGKQVKRTSLVHDEYSWEVEDGIEEEIRQLTVECIIKAGEYLKLPLPLDGEGKIGKNWKDVH